MEVLIRWRCHLCRQPSIMPCRYCHNKGFLERWVPYSLLKDIQEAVTNTLIISGRRKLSDFPADPATHNHEVPSRS